MALDWLINDVPEYRSRGQRILSVLNGEDTVDILPGNPDVRADVSDWNKGDKFDPDIEFDANSFSRMDKFDALEVAQHMIDNSLNSVNSRKNSSTEAKAEVNDSSGSKEK